MNAPNTEPSATGPQATPHREKRAAFEPVDALVDRGSVASAPPKRPLATTLGTVFVLFRAVSGLLWMLAIALIWESEIVPAIDMPADAGGTVLAIVLTVSGLSTLVLVVLGVMIWRGSNLARVLVMVGLTLSIITAAVGYFSYGEKITLATTLLTLSVDILVLLALSSRDARLWSRYRIAARRGARD